MGVHGSSQTSCRLRSIDDDATSNSEWALGIDGKELDGIALLVADDGILKNKCLQHVSLHRIIPLENAKFFGVDPSVGFDGASRRIRRSSPPSSHYTI